MFSRSIRLNLVVQVYIAGIAITIMIAMFVGLYPTIAPPWLIMVVGITHLLLLAYLACRVGDRPYVLTQAGNRVQSAGYLHTLIGFFSAIITLGQGSFSISALSFPLASALLTSLIGWWAGGEISARGEAENPNLEEATQQIVQTLENYSNKLSSVQERHLSRLEQDSDRLLTLQQTHARELEDQHKKHADRLLAFYKGYNSELVRLYEDISKSSSTISSEFSSFGTSLSKDKENIRNSLSGFDSIIDQQTRAFQSSLQSYNSASVEISNYANALSGNMKLLDQSSLSASQEVAKIIQSMQAASTQVQGWSKETSYSISQVNQLVRDFQQLANNTNALLDNMKLLNQDSLSASQEVKKIIQSMQAASTQMQSWSKETSHSISQVNQLVRDFQQLAKYVVEQRGDSP